MSKRQGIGWPPTGRVNPPKPNGTVKSARNASTVPSTTASKMFVDRRSMARFVQPNVHARQRQLRQIRGTAQAVHGLDQNPHAPTAANPFDDGFDLARRPHHRQQHFVSAARDGAFDFRRRQLTRAIHTTDDPGIRRSARSAQIVVRVAIDLGVGA